MGDTLWRAMMKENAQENRLQIGLKKFSILVLIGNIENLLNEVPLKKGRFMFGTQGPVHIKSRGHLN